MFSPVSQTLDDKDLDDEALWAEESTNYHHPKKIARFSLAEATSPPAPLVMVKHVQRTPTTPSSYCSDYQIQSPVNCSSDCSVMTHSLSGRFPTVDLFKEYQNAAMAVGTYYNHVPPSFYKSIEFDDNRNVQRAEFIIRAHMQGGRFSDGWGSCDRREKRFIKPNNDIPSTAETRAKNKACQDLLGIGEYRPVVNAQR
ncbi:hypothetical protein L1987_59924 [Smallanthus sonchifolius]|uniref:Uncharacterized protein n=1 Tax=Smallanthus sonchifolius TaxID=185202 RepID=A0ACB9D6N3_9ASTR|nr:hypothetical protein L1987_59924 [Smallanthus sonchifolius]